MKTVLIIAYECRPYNRVSSTIGAQRPFQFAKWLGEYGWKTIVVCSDFASRRTIIDAASAREAARNIVREKMLEFEHGTSVIIPLPTPRSSGFVDRVWSLCVVRSEKGTFHYPSTFKRIVGRIASLFKLFSGDYSSDLMPIGKEAVREIIVQQPIDFVIAEHGPDAGIFLASWINLNYRIPWIVDFRDPIFQPYSSVKYVIYKTVITKVMKTCSATINVSENWSKIDAKEFGKRAYVISNGFDEDEFGKSPSSRTFPANLKFSYFGNVSRPLQQTDMFFSFLQMLSTQEIDFCFQYIGGAYIFVKEQAEIYGVINYCDIRDQTARKEVIDSYGMVQFLIIFPSQDDGYYSDGFLPGKLFEYLGSGKPIICFSNFNTILERILTDTGAGLVFSSAEEAVGFFNTSGWQNKLPTRDSGKIALFSRRNTAGKLAKILDQFD